MPSYEFDPFKLTGLTIENTNARDGALSAIAEYVKEQALIHIGDGVSPIQGGRWKRTLSPSKAREFIPKGNQTFKKSIIQGIAEIIEGYGGRRD